MNVVSFISGIERLGFSEYEENVYEIENRDWSYDDNSDYMGYEECHEGFINWVIPIGEEVERLAKEYEIKLDIDESCHYGILSIRILN
jgi:hypothetical protein